MWTYDVSHGILLLRHFSSINSQRIDVVFSDVRVVEIGTFLNGIDIVIDSGFNGKLAQSKEATEPGLNAYKITTQDWVGHIIAGGVRWQIDVAHADQASKIYKPSRCMYYLASNGYST